MIEIICYTGGTCGDLLTALIDNKDTKFFNNAVQQSPHRSKLKKPFLFKNDTEKDQYIDSIGNEYMSVPSHDVEYHISRNHDFIGITVTDFELALWASTRFKNLHRNNVWDEMCKSCGANSVNDYANILISYSNMIINHTNRIVNLNDIVNGNALDALKKINVTACSESKIFYANWIKLQQGIHHK